VSFILRPVVPANLRSPPCRLRFEPYASAISLALSPSLDSSSGVSRERTTASAFDHSPACDTFDRWRLLRYMIARPGL